MSLQLNYLTELYQKLNDEIIKSHQDFNESNSNLNALETLKLIELLVVSNNTITKTPQLLSLIRKGIENEEKFKS